MLPIGLPATGNKTLGSAPNILLPSPAAKQQNQYSLELFNLKEAPSQIKGALLNYFLRSFCKDFSLAAASASWAVPKNSQV
ncbi:MAG: hypothetical protein Ct9H300mP20_06240 [Gammaproteobacteria bacterium]|nr:MAG: hypothetical protein Ct9H300mP20_06240 [Gammaproteobacteria bacterium]